MRASLPLRRVATVVAGQSPPAADVQELADGKPFLQGNAEFGHVNPHARWQCGSAPKTCLPGDLLLSVRAPVGALAWADQAYGIGRGLAALRLSGGGDRRYLAYAIRARIPELRASSSGTTFEAVTANDIGELSIPWVDLEDQRRIADFLDDQVSLVDSAISATRKQVHLLQERLQAVFTDVVDTQADTVRLSRLLRLGAVGVVVNPSSYFEEEGVPFVHGYNVRDGHFDLSDLKRMSEASSRLLRRSRLQVGDVLVVRAGYPGRAAVVTEELAGGNCASVLLLRPGRNLLPDYLAAFFNGAVGKSLVDQAQYGAAQGVINLGDVAAFEIPVPSLREQSALVGVLKRRLSETDRLRIEIARAADLLVERKRALIAAAVTGEFDVSSAGLRAAAAVMA